LNNAKAAYATFKKYFPESKYLKDADKALTKVEKELEIYSK
jgi:outer membrane protein assembly factor BamD